MGEGGKASGELSTRKMLVPLWLLCPGLSSKSQIWSLPWVVTRYLLPPLRSHWCISFLWLTVHSLCSEVGAALLEAPSEACFPSLSEDRRQRRGVQRQGAASALPRSLVSCFHLTLAPRRYVLKELWRECFAKLSEVPKSAESWERDEG